MRIAIIICTKDRPNELMHCYNSIKLQTYKSFYLIIVDASEENRIQQDINLYQSEEIDITYVKSAPGLPFQRNIGVSHVRPGTDIIIFLDDDTELTPDYVKTLAMKFNDDRNKLIIGACGNALNEKKRKRIDRLIRNAFFITDNATGKLLPSGDAGHIFSPQQDSKVAVLSGCNMCYRTEVFDRYNLKFDENLNGYAIMEDQDFSIRASRYGDLYQFAGAKLLHKVSPVARINQKRLFEMYIINSYYLLKKNMAPNYRNYICYSWRLVGKLIHAIANSIRFNSYEPLAGWINGIIKINSLVKLLQEQPENSPPSTEK